MDINYELYKVFYYVATSLSFSEASKQLYISQSAVSQSIKTLEKKLEQPLFIRSTKKVQLTQAGKVLLKHIEPAMNLIRRGENQLLDTNTLGLGQVHIGASDTICRYFLVPYLKEFHKQFPNVPIKVTNATSLSCVDLLELLIYRRLCAVSFNTFLQFVNGIIHFFCSRILINYLISNADTSGKIKTKLNVLVLSFTSRRKND